VITNQLPSGGEADLFGLVIFAVAGIVMLCRYLYSRKK